MEITAIGSLDGQELKKSRVKTFLPADKYKFDGYQLDTLSITAEIKSKQDVDDLILFLGIHKHCFIQ